MTDTNPYEPPRTEVPATQGALALEGASITASMLQQLKATRPWVRFFSVMGFIGTGFMLLAGAAMAVAGVVSRAEWPFVLALAALYFVVGGLYVLPTLQLHFFASAVGRVFSQGGVASIEEALRRQASFWRTSGILVIASMGLGVLAVIGMGVYAVIAAVGR